MKIQNLTPEDVYRTLLTSAHGLSEEEARRRLEEYGPNRIQEVRKKPFPLRLIAHFTHFLATLLWVAAALCFLSEYLHPGEGMVTLGFAIVAVICINAFFTFLQEYRTEKALEALRKLLPFMVRVLREGREREIRAEEVVPGDVLFLSEGDKIPADARLIESADVKVNNAPLTGESEPVSRNHMPCNGDLVESVNIVFAGTTLVSGSGKAVAFATGMATEFGRIAHLTSAVESGLSPLQKEIVRTTRIIATVAGVVGVFFFVLGFFIGRHFWDNFIFAIGITVALIPEGMLPTMTLALAMASQRMAKRNALVKTLTSVETLGGVTVICTDKTGTLTQNAMSVRALWIDGAHVDAAEFPRWRMHEIVRIAGLCNDARFVDGKYRGDSTDVALLEFSRKVIGELSVERIREIPFDSERKRMTTVHRSKAPSSSKEDTVVVYSKGALESILPLCDRIEIEGSRLTFTHR